jgi:isopenicillin-N epimerase
MRTGRRRFLSDTGRAIGAAAVISQAAIARVRAAAGLVAASPEEAAKDEAFWFAVRQAYDLDSRYVILNAGASNPMPRAVEGALTRYTRYVNGAPLMNTYAAMVPHRESVRRRIARLVHASPDEIALTRNTTESLQVVIFGLRLDRGDEILATNFDYYSMIDAIRQREKRDGIVLKQVALDLPPKDPGELVAAVERGITPRTKAVLISHVIDGVGQIMPVRRISDLAHARGIQVIVDGALSFGHIACDMEALGCDYFGTSLHKWLSAPLGTGFLYVKRPRIGDLWPLLADGAPESSDIRKFERIGTHSVASFAAIGPALDFYEGIGVERKRARLHYLKRYWADRLAPLAKVRLGTPLGPEDSCAIAHVGIEGVGSKALSKHLLDEKGIYAFPIVREGLDGVYVSPNVFTPTSDLDLFVEAMTEVARNGLPGG